MRKNNYFYVAALILELVLINHVLTAMEKGDSCGEAPRPMVMDVNSVEPIASEILKIGQVLSSVYPKDRILEQACIDLDSYLKEANTEKRQQNIFRATLIIQNRLLQYAIENKHTFIEAIRKCCCSYNATNCCECGICALCCAFLCNPEYFKQIIEILVAKAHGE